MTLVIIIELWCMVSCQESHCFILTPRLELIYHQGIVNNVLLATDWHYVTRYGNMCTSSQTSTKILQHYSQHSSGAVKQNRHSYCVTVWMSGSQFSHKFV